MLSFWSLQEIIDAEGDQIGDHTSSQCSRLNRRDAPCVFQCLDESTNPSLQGASRSYIADRLPSSSDSSIWIEPCIWQSQFVEEQGFVRNQKTQNLAGLIGWGLIYAFVSVFLLKRRQSR